MQNKKCDNWGNFKQSHLELGGTGYHFVPCIISHRIVWLMFCSTQNKRIWDVLQSSSWNLNLPLQASKDLIIITSLLPVPWKNYTWYFILFLFFKFLIKPCNRTTQGITCLFLTRPAKFNGGVLPYTIIGINELCNHGGHHALTPAKFCSGT